MAHSTQKKELVWVQVLVVFQRLIYVVKLKKLCFLPTTLAKLTTFPYQLLSEIFPLLCTTKRRLLLISLHKKILILPEKKGLPLS
jgi:hypothetical protein